MNNSIVEHNVTSSNTSMSSPSSAIYNDGGETKVSESHITLDTTNTYWTYSNLNAYAVYSPTGTFEIESGNIVGSSKGPTYGVYTESGNVIIGIPEPTDSQDYGKDTADVSLNNPNIRAFSISSLTYNNDGVGVKNNGGGKVYYYDGRIAGATAALPEDPTKTEFHYEVCREMDTSVTPNMEFTRLFWVREGGQSSCTNE